MVILHSEVDCFPWTLLHHSDLSCQSPWYVLTRTVLFYNQWHCSCPGYGDNLSFVFCRHTVGDTKLPFCLQSCVKPLKYAVAVHDHGTEYVHGFIGKEPSGLRFNKLFLDDDGETSDFSFSLLLLLPAENFISSYTVFLEMLTWWTLILDWVLCAVNRGLCLGIWCFLFLHNNNCW